jgi:NAD(P)-dependent dehydrogenase (short-subunit alcohol dehydrogenase family)
MFAAEGATVIGIDREDADVVCDLLEEEEVRVHFAWLGREYGRVDILVNAAAFAHFAWIEAMNYAQWRETLAGELDIVFLATRAAWPYLKASGTASVINFASANAAHALPGSPALAHCAGKGGVLAMTRQLAMEGAPHGIRANTISPGFIRTAATERHLASDPALEVQVRAKNMLDRVGEPADIAWCATWLASDEARYVTGADIAVDAGATAW